jgi:hypothetical protein
MVCNMVSFYGEALLANSPSRKLRETPCRLSATAHSIHSQLPPILEDVAPSATEGRILPW